MNLPRWNLVLFALIGVLAVIVLVALPGERGDRGGFDTRTGLRSDTIWEVMSKARRSGDARVALFILERLRGSVSEAPLVQNALGILKAELDTPQLREIDIEAVATKPLLDRWAVLASKSDDEVIARATASFFRPVIDELEDGDVRGPDVRSVLLVAQLKVTEDEDLRQRLPAIEALVRSYAASGRARAARRWRLRGLQIDPANSFLRDGLTKDAIAQGRLGEAWIAQAGEVQLDEATEDVEAFWDRRSKLATWLGLQEQRALALEKSLSLTKDAERAESIRRDLVAVYPVIGEPERAVPHAICLAQQAGQLAEVEAAGYLALESGRVEEGLSVLADLARELRGDDQRVLREKIAAFALQDLRVDYAMRILEEQLASAYDAVLARRLEGFYRQFGMHTRLSASLERRLDTGDTSVGLELLSLLVARADRRSLARTVAKLAGVPAEALRSRDVASTDERDPYGDGRDRAPLPGLAANVFTDPRIRPDTLFGMIRRLRPLFDKPELRAVIKSALARFPESTNAIDLRRELVDLESDPSARALAAKELFETHSKDPELLRFWVERASWTDDAAHEIEARERLAREEPGDLENLESLAALCEAEGRHEEALKAWRRVSDGEGSAWRAQAKVVRLLFTLGRSEDALAEIDAALTGDSSNTSMRVQAAELLFSENRADAALAYYKAVLADEADHELALLRCGQILSWSNEARSAIPYLERLVELEADELGRVYFYLAEAYASVGRAEDAARVSKAAVADLRARESSSFEGRSMLAKALTRVGDFKAAEPLFLALLEERPDSDDLRLDWAETLVVVGRWREARRNVAIPLRRNPKNRRALRVDGTALAKGGKLREAVARYEDFLELEGEDSAILSDLAFLRERQGDWHGAQDKFRRWLALRPDSREAASSELRIFDLLADTVRVTHVHERIGDDRRTELRAHSSRLIEGDHLRLAASVGMGSWEGQAALVPGQKLRESAALLDIQLEHRFRGKSCVAAGLMANPGVPGEYPIGVWLATQLVDSAPYRMLEARVFLGELWTDVPAATSLEGRAHGFELASFAEVGGAWWLGGDFGMRALSIDPSHVVANASAETDGEVTASVSIGRRILEAPVAIDPLWRTRHCASARVSPELRAREDDDRSVLLQSYVTFATQRLLGDRRLATMLPVATRSTSLRLTLAGEGRVVDTFGVGAELSLGHEFESSSLLWGLGASATWRPSRGHELSAFLSSGRALGRQGDASSLLLGLQWVVRW